MAETITGTASCRTAELFTGSMARVIGTTNDARYIVTNRIEPVLASPGASIYDQLILAT